MPIWLRQTTFNLIKEHYDKEAKEYEKHNEPVNKDKVARPNIPNPTYTTKAPQK